MKKLISLLLAFIFCLIPVTAFAEGSVPEEMNIMMGDLNGDGKVSAIDARSALRYAAKLEPSDGIELLTIDADGDGRISASDARAILRVAARISQFVAGFDGNGTPNVINTIRSDMYYMEIENYDESKDMALGFSVARNNDNIYMITDDVNMMGDMGMSDVFKITKCGMMLTGEDIYALMSTDAADIAMFISKEMQNELDMTPDSLYEIVNMVSDFVPETLGEPSRVNINGKDMFCYTYSVAGQQCQMFVGTNGVLSHIDGLMKNGDMETIITFNKISGDKPDGYFDLNSFDEIW